ncbi:MAG: transglycosylase domain-containing protein [Thermoleophilaceae bacterium]
MPEPPTSTLSRTRPLDRQPPPYTNGGPPVGPRTRLKKLRLALILVGLTLLALVSTVFGMLMAVASDLPALENRAEFRAAKNSVLEAADGRHTEIARLTGNDNRILLTEPEISQNIKNAVVAIEDRRFYEHGGVDYKGIARALSQDLLRQKAAQGGSTITQQFVKNALSAQGHRSVFQKLREAALAYHLERQWSKQKILAEYLNTVYFGNGAYGVESAVRTYFANGAEELQSAAVDRHRASDVTPAQAALLAGMIASPSMYDPVEHPRLAKERRDLVLRHMLDQRMISRADYDHAVVTVLPTRDRVNPPRPDSQQPYFSSWLTQQLVDRYRPGVVFGGGLKIRTTLDPDLQAAAEHAISGHLAGVGPSASLVAIENRTGEIKAMVGGTDFAQTPFNLATNGHRQPGSSFKPFTLIGALEDGVSPDATFASRPKVFPVPGSRKEKFPVRNYEDHYLGTASLRTATAFSDNSVYAELGLKVGTRKIARIAQRMGIQTPVSTNPAMTLGGLKQGLTPLELAYAYSAIANKGVKVSGSLASGGEGPVAVENVRGSGIADDNEKRTERVFPKSVGETAQELLAGVLTSGTGKAAAISEPAAGKTGTTENYGDAWFVGFNKELTVAVWVGYPDQLRPMKTEFHGGPVAGGTYPAEIWHDLMTAWIGIRDTRDAESGKDRSRQPALPGPVGPAAPQVPAAPTQTAPSGGGKASPAKPAPQQKKPRQPAPTPAPAPQGGQPAPSGGAGGGAQPPSG